MNGGAVDGGGYWAAHGRHLAWLRSGGSRRGAVAHAAAGLRMMQLPATVQRPAAMTSAKVVAAGLRTMQGNISQSVAEQRQIGNEFDLHLH
ncbi:hypothetical protein Syun_016508 [Stephania yunnanensis]|uniref:Uncharacterized protein n=1 Tax=Stephania yunnanensis TaxID=152371 RepID=A0AAP0J7N2_9MAGN